MVERSNNLIWIDLEMTGLDPKEHKIIEIATIVTDSQLNLLAQGPVIAIYQPEDELAKMDDWNLSTHTKTGLLERVKNSKIETSLAEKMTLDFLFSWVDKAVSPICGNTVAQDKRFLYEYMPKLADYFHYRHIDVSTMKELVRRWSPSILDGLQKSEKHQALDDIQDSINELKYYREKIFKI